MAEANREELAEKLLTAMADANVDHAIVVPLSSDDEYLQEILNRFPGKFAGVGVFDHSKLCSTRDLENRLVRTKHQGLRFFGLEASADCEVTSLSCYPILEFMAEAGMVVWFYGDLVQLAALDKVMTLLPSLMVVLNHCGFLPDIHTELQIDSFRRPHFSMKLPPIGLQAVEKMAQNHANIYVHFSGHYAFSHEEYPYRDFTEIAHRLYVSFGAKRMLWASDWPWIECEPGYARVLSLVDILLPKLNTEELDAIRGLTALMLFNFLT